MSLKFNLMLIICLFPFFGFSQMMGDNLGNHKATKDLNMAGNSIRNILELTDVNGDPISGGGGSSYDQDLNTTDAPTFEWLNLTSEDGLVVGNMQYVEESENIYRYYGINSIENYTYDSGLWNSSTDIQFPKFDNGYTGTLFGAWTISFDVLPEDGRTTILTLEGDLDMMGNSIINLPSNSIPLTAITGLTSFVILDGLWTNTAATNVIMFSTNFISEPNAQITIRDDQGELMSIFARAYTDRLEYVIRNSAEIQSTGNIVIYWTAKGEVP